jgi:toxin ParE1/3/4
MIRADSADLLPRGLHFSRERARIAEGIVHRPRHLIVYRDFEKRELEVIRILHDGMEMRRHLPKD